MHVVLGAIVGLISAATVVAISNQIASFGHQGLLHPQTIQAIMIWSPVGLVAGAVISGLIKVKSLLAKSIIAGATGGAVPLVIIAPPTAIVGAGMGAIVGAAIGGIVVTIQKISNRIM